MIGWDYKSQDDKKLQEDKKGREARARDSLVWDVKGDQRLGCWIGELPVMSVHCFVGERLGCHICTEGTAVGETQQAGQKGFHWFHKRLSPSMSQGAKKGFLTDWWEAARNNLPNLLLKGQPYHSLGHSLGTNTTNRSGRANTGLWAPTFNTTLDTRRDFENTQRPFNFKYHI